MTEIRTTDPVLVLIEHQDRSGEFLLEFNENWRAAMFPVTRPKKFEDERWGSAVQESPEEAAGRAACEATGLLTKQADLKSLGAMKITAVSQSTGDVTSYDFTGFRMFVSPDTPGFISEKRYWLTLENILDPELMPISPIARKIAKILLERQLDSPA